MRTTSLAPPRGSFKEMPELSQDQKKALEIMEGRKNVFLTGRAGSGKSFLTSYFLCGKDPEKTPVLASTGAAALLVGGRTFHSFFGLGILEGGPERTIERSLRNPKNVRRIRKADTVLVDEISMLSGTTLAAAEAIARLARNSDEPWGGLHVIFVGDFAQLPPVTRMGEAVDWAFLHEVWAKSDLIPLSLETIHRSTEAGWLSVLNKVRDGICDGEVTALLRSREGKVSEDFEATRLFPHRATAEKYNLFRLDKISGDPTEIATIYAGEERHVESLKRQAPIPEVLLLKEGALVMIRRNDMEGLYVNGSLGYVRRITKASLSIELLESGLRVDIEPVSFELYDGDGETIASAKNFPVTLAYGSTIHKAQGATLDRVVADLRSLWEAGQAYVALSRVRRSADITLESWQTRSIKADPSVAAFHANLKRL